jgi:hypothetical protein
MDDVGVVLDAVSSGRAAFCGCHLGGRLGLLFAPPGAERAVVTLGSHPASLRDEDYPWGSSQEQREALLAASRVTLGAGRLPGQAGAARGG